jgi:hypothetical protein
MRRISLSRKQLLITMCCLLSVRLAESTLAEDEITYAGKAKIPGLGEVAFPAGRWKLENKVLQSAPNTRHRPDTFVFRKDTESIERLTILRYAISIAPPLANMLDMLGSSVGDGIPRDSGVEKITGTCFQLLLQRSDKDSKQGHIGYSFVFDPGEQKARWLCHCLLSNSPRGTFVIVHTSHTVTWPDDVQEVWNSSKFDTAP